MDQGQGQHFGPLPSSNFNRDDLLQWLSQQTISAQKLITGSIQAGQEIGSANYAAGSAGWQIDGDGNAEFNDVTIRGTVTASTITGSLFRTAASGERLVIDGDTGEAFIRLYNASAEVARIGVDVGGLGGNNVFIDHRAGLGSGTGILLAESGTVLAGLQYGPNAINQWVVPPGGDLLGVITPGLAFTGDTNTGIYRPGTDQVGIAVGGVLGFQQTALRTFLPVAQADTSAGGANAIINTTTGRIQRSTSSLKYKPDWRWARDAADYALPTPIRWTDERGQVRLGFGAEHIHEVVPEAFESEIYDIRSLVAILSEKVKRLERTSLTRRLAEGLRRQLARGLRLPFRYRAAQ